jgi:hypothetical protein
MEDLEDKITCEQVKGELHGIKSGQTSVPKAVLARLFIT